MSDPWIRLHANLAHKPVVWRLSDHCGIPKHEAMGLLAEFWGNVSQHAKNGQVTHLPDTQIEAWADWRGERGKFASFVRTQHVDSQGRVNEWTEYHGKLELRRESDRLRKEVQRKSAGTTADSADKKRTTIRNDTIQTTKTTTSAARTEKASWLEPIRAKWEQYNGSGSFSTVAGQAAKALAPIRQAGSSETAIAARLGVYLFATDAKFRNITKFAQSFDTWKIDTTVVGGEMSADVERLTRPRA